MARMQAVYHRDAQGREPVSDFIDALKPVAAQVAPRQPGDRLNMLEHLDPPLPFPHSSQVEGELQELRCHYGGRLFCVLYRRSERLFVLLHVFEKTTRQVPEAGKVIARHRWEDFRRRMDERPRRPPRAAGRDAP